MKRLGEILFVVVFVVALSLYGLTAPNGLPWNYSTHLALAYLGEVLRLPQMPHPFWGYHVQALGGAVALSIFSAALAAGLLATLVNRYFGWKASLCVVTLWIFMPSVWNRAITGERSICLVSMVVVALWMMNAVMLRVLKKARDAKIASDKQGQGDISTIHARNEKRGKIMRIVSWIFLGAVGLFATVSLTLHDYQLGEAASVFAKGVVEAAGERIIILNGVCDGQIINELKLKVEVEERNSHSNFSAIALRNDEAYRTNLVAWVKSAFPTETNLWVAAQVSPTAFVAVATEKHLDRFYLMTGASTTLERWEKRWEDFKPYLNSSDPFVPVARRMFGIEGNAVANAMLEGTGNREQGAEKKVYALYKRVYTEVAPGNFSALVNMSEMIRCGAAVSGDEKRWVQDKLEAFFKDAANRKNVREIARAAGPVRMDPKLMEEMAAETKKRISAKIAAGEKIELKPEVLSLVEWSNEMCQLMDQGDLVKAGRIARAILTNPKWQGFIPANAVMGSVAASEGDYVASERFFQLATGSTNKVVTSVLNNYADTLMHLGKLDEAEKIARRAIRESDEKYWLARLTLAEILEKKEVNEQTLVEIRTLLKSVLKNSPVEWHEQIRKTHKDYLR